MKKLLLLLVMALTTSQGFAMNSLSELYWKKRTVLVFGEAGDPRVDRQLNLLRNKVTELEDRDLVLIRISGEDADVVYGDATKPSGRVLREETEIGGGFHVILVGKDGGVKFRSETLVEDLNLFDIIDRMPMRRAENGQRP
jgi:hypothetical protein